MTLIETLKSVITGDRFSLPEAERTASARGAAVTDSDADDGNEQESVPIEATGKAGADLYHCPDCDTVYVANGKTTCSSCRTDVKRVEKTF